MALLQSDQQLVPAQDSETISAVNGRWARLVFALPSVSHGSLQSDTGALGALSSG
ncbi:uncharacterized, partial [Tachysurus ichikawai]